MFIDIASVVGFLDKIPARTALIDDSGSLRFSGRIPIAVSLLER